MGEKLSHNRGPNPGPMLLWGLYEVTVTSVGELHAAASKPIIMSVSVVVLAHALTASSVAHLADIHRHT